MLEFPHDVHVHTVYSDGLGDPGEVIAAGERRGLRLLGISDHSHYLLDGAIEKYVREIRHWGKEADMPVLAGIEANVTPSGVDIPHWAASKLEYVIASVHAWLETPSQYIELVKMALTDEDVDIIGHFGANFPYTGFPSVEEMREVLELAESEGKAFEISSRYRVPEVDFVRECVRRGIKLAFASDAHRIGDVGGVSWSEKVFKKAGGRKEDLLFSEFL